MLKKLMMATALSGFAASAALAQATNPPVTTSPMTNPPAATQSLPSAQLNTAKFIEMQGHDQWVFSKFKGTDVLGPDNAHIGDVNDLLFDKNAKLIAIVVGVGGFLGIGEKNVAIDMSAFQVVPADINSATASRNDDPNNIKLRVSWTKDQLKAAPSFQYYKSSATVGQRDRVVPAPAPAPVSPRPLEQR